MNRVFLTLKLEKYMDTRFIFLFQFTDKKYSMVERFSVEKDKYISL